MCPTSADGKQFAARRLEYAFPSDPIAPITPRWILAQAVQATRFMGRESPMLRAWLEIRESPNRRRRAFGPHGFPPRSRLLRGNGEVGLCRRDTSPARHHLRCRGLFESRIFDGEGFPLAPFISDAQTKLVEPSRSPRPSFSTSSSDTALFLRTVELSTRIALDLRKPFIDTPAPLSPIQNPP